MSSLTPRLELIKPTYTETADIDVINDNMDLIDGAVGVSIVNTVASISSPYNGQFAYELTNSRLLFYISGSWLLVAAGDQNSGNPNRIRLPSNAISDIDDTTNAFQIGPDSGVNLAVDQKEIQARNNGAAATLALNPYGGAVEVGITPGLTIQKAGIKSDAMVSAEATDSSTITGVTATSWATGSPNVNLGTITAPPSGRFAITLCADMEGNAASSDAMLSYDCHRNSNGNQIFGPGAVNSRILRVGNGRATVSVTDIIGSFIPGENYNFTVFQQKSGSGTPNPNIYFRKILCLPVL